MFIASLIELPIAKTRMWQKHNIQFANFDLASLRVVWFRWTRFWVPGHIETSVTREIAHGELLISSSLSGYAAV